MPRKRVPAATGCPVHVTVRSNSKDRFPLPMDRLWFVFEDYLYLMKVGFGIKIHCFVLMNNHFHLIVSAPQNNLSAALKYGLREISKEIGRLTNTRNHQFGNRSFCSAISNYHYYMHAYKYVYQNPVVAGICSRPEDYPYSTLHGLLGKSRLLIPVEEDLLLFDNLGTTLEWLNEPADPLKRQAIKKALRRAEFKLSKDPGRRRSCLEDELY